MSEFLKVLEKAPVVAEGEENSNLAESDSPEKPKIGSPEYISKTMPNVWVYDGEAYDLSDFMKQHPGGEFFIGRMKNRDITTLVNVLHSNPEKVKKRLRKYALGRKATASDLHSKYNAPPFLFKDDFDAIEDTPQFNFKQESQLLNKIRQRLKAPNVKAEIARMDRIFDVVTAVLAFAYFGVQILRLGFAQYMPIYLFVPMMVMLRISLSGAGHYLNHRALVGWNKALSHIFDISYVPMAFVVVDGHTLMHHPYTQSEVDVKRNVFTAMMELPRYYRLPLHTVHKLGHVLTGMFVRTVEICTYAVKYGVENFYATWQRGLPHYLGMIGMRLLLFGELVLFWQQGELIAWFAQFALTTWISTFLIVASHDFEVDETAANPQAEDDWAVFQIENSYDLTMIGNKYVDCFLSAGLSPHRVHHVLPYQRSGFANIASEAIVREEAEKVGLVWRSPKNFFIDRLPVMIQYYLLSPSRLARDKELTLVQEHLSPSALRDAASYVYKGFIGVGSI
ncbi:MAG: cytochrome b5-like heme/steroid binding domain-containing protein [Phormidesmis sp.]